MMIIFILVPGVRWFNVTVNVIQHEMVKKSKSEPVCITTAFTPYRKQQIASWHINPFKLRSVKCVISFHFYKYTHIPKKVRVKFTKFPINMKLQVLIDNWISAVWCARHPPPLHTTNHASARPLTATDSPQKESIRHWPTLFSESIQQRIILRRFGERKCHFDFDKLFKLWLWHIIRLL